MNMLAINTKDHDFYLIEIKDNELIYTNEPSKKTYLNKENSLFNVYTLSVKFSGDYFKHIDSATLKVMSGSHAIEQEIRSFYVTSFDQLTCELERTSLPYSL